MRAYASGLGQSTCMRARAAKARAHLQELVQGASEAALLQRAHGLPIAADAGKQQLARIENVLVCLYLQPMLPCAYATAPCL